MNSSNARSQHARDYGQEADASAWNEHTTEFLVQITQKGVTKQVLWSPEEPLHLDHPARHLLEMHDGRLFVRDSWNEQTDIAISGDAIESGRPVEIESKVHKLKITLRIHVLRRARAAYLPASDSRRQGLVPSAPEYFFSSGYAESLYSYEPLKDSLVTKHERAKVFSIKRSAAGLQVTALANGVTLEVKGKNKAALIPGQSALIQGLDAESVTLHLGAHWWRINKVLRPHVPTIDQKALHEVDPESIYFKKLARNLGVVSVLSLAIAWLTFAPNKAEKEKPLEQATIVQLKQFTKKAAKKPEPPKKEEVVVAKKEEPKPVEKKPEKKVAKQEPKKPEKKVAKVQPKPAPRIVQKPVPQKPVVVAKPVIKPTPIQKRPPAPMVAQRPVVKPVAPPPKPQPTAEQLRAQAQAKVAASLGFLSAAPSKISKTAPAFAAEANPNAKYQAAQGASAQLGKANSAVLVAMANSAGNGAEFINTKGSRSISGSTGVSGRGKALNEVQGRVSLASLANYGGGEMGGSLEGGLQMSGAGSISEDELRKVLSKYLQRFQYCYEKALLTNANLGGSLTMQWTIVTTGKAQEVRVVKSALNNTQLHNCVSSELGRIPFPHPKGGSVTIKYPFSFSATAL